MRIAAELPGIAWPRARLDLAVHRARLWLRRRRDAAALRMVEPRLREDAGLPAIAWPEAGMVSAALPFPTMGGRAEVTERAGR